MYLITFLCSTLMLYEAEKYRDSKLIGKSFLLIALLVPSLIAGLRDYTIGADVLLYGNYWFNMACSYSSLPDFLSKANEYSIGIGYATANYVIARFTNDAHVFYFVYELIQMVLLYKALEPYREKINIPFSFLIYYFMWYNLSLNILRQNMAILIILFAYQYVKEKKPIHFMLCILIAISFHRTAFIGVFYYIITIAVESKLGKFFRVLIVSVFLIVIAFYKQVFIFLTRLNILSADRYSHYMEDSLVGGRLIRIGFWLVLFILFLMYKNKMEDYWDQSKMMFFWVTISVVMSALMFVASTWVIRISYYFDILTVVSLPVLAKCIQIRDRTFGYKIRYIIVIIPVFVYWLMTFIIRNGAATYPYIFYFMGNGN